MGGSIRGPPVARPRRYSVSPEAVSVFHALEALGTGVRDGISAHNALDAHLVVQDFPVHAVPEIEVNGLI